MHPKLKINATEYSILLTASTRRNGAALPLPNGADPTTPKATKLLNRLVKAGMLEEQTTTTPGRAWRTDDDGKHWSLKLTAAGRVKAAATNVSDGQPEVIAQIDESDATATVPVAEDPPPPRGKLGQVLSAVQQTDGASIDELITLTGWQAHTVRATLTRLRRSGVPICLAEISGARRYVAAQNTGGEAQ